MTTPQTIVLGLMLFLIGIWLIAIAVEDAVKNETTVSSFDVVLLLIIVMLVVGLYSFFQGIGLFSEVLLS